MEAAVSWLSGGDQRADFCRQLATMVDSGMTIVRSLQVLQERPIGGRLRRFLDEAVRATSRGDTLSSVITRYPDLFSALVAAIITAGERSGRLDESLQRVATYLERDRELQRLVRRETFYLKIVAAACVLIPLAARAFIAGWFGGAAAALRVLLSGLGWTALTVIVPLAVLIWLYRRLRATQAGAETIDRLKIQAPLLGGIVRRLTLARFSRALAAGYRSGLSLSESLRLAAGAAGNRAIAQIIMRAAPQVERGAPLSQALAGAGLVDSMVLSMLATGEQTGNVDAMMEKVADHYEAEGEASVRKGMMLIVPVGTIVAGIAVLYMAAQAYAGYFGAIFDAAH